VVHVATSYVPITPRKANINCLTHKDDERDGHCAVAHVDEAHSQLLIVFQVISLVVTVCQGASTLCRQEADIGQAGYLNRIQHGLLLRKAGIGAYLHHHPIASSCLLEFLEVVRH